MNGKVKWDKAKMLGIGIIVFFGSMFTLMAYHNDVAIAEVFWQFYESVQKRSSPGITEVEICYCIGIIFGTGGFLKHAS